jgi:hypothetical protein
MLSLAPALDQRNENITFTALGLGGFGGALLGAGLGFFLTRHTDDAWRPLPSARIRGGHFTLAPVGPNGTLGLSLGGTF